MLRIRIILKKIRELKKFVTDPDPDRSLILIRTRAKKKRIRIQANRDSIPGKLVLSWNLFSGSIEIIRIRRIRISNTGRLDLVNPGLTDLRVNAGLDIPNQLTRLTDLLCPDQLTRLAYLVLISWVDLLTWVSMLVSCTLISWFVSTWKLVE